jgi:hypothetical protein
MAGLRRAALLTERDTVASVIWFLVWFVLVLFALGVFFLVGRSLWRKAVALLGELATASERFSSIADTLETVGAPGRTAPELAVFSDPGLLRQQRIQAVRSRARHRASR